MTVNRPQIKHIAITGGIGSGKSVVAKILSSMNYPLYDSDLRAKKIMQNSEEIKLRILQIFGSKALKNGEINRKFISDIVFNDKLKLKQLNEAVHQAVIADYLIWRKDISDEIISGKDASACLNTGKETSNKWEGFSEKSHNDSACGVNSFRSGDRCVREDSCICDDRRVREDGCESGDNNGRDEVDVNNESCGVDSDNGDFGDSCSLIFVESAILCESGLINEVDCVWTVTAPLELRIERVMKRNGITREEVIARVESQNRCENYATQGAGIIVNDNEMAILPQIQALLNAEELLNF